MAAVGAAEFGSGGLISQAGGNQKKAGGGDDGSNGDGFGEGLALEQFLGLLHEHAELAVVYFHIPHLPARIERRERGGRIGGLRSLIFVLNPILGTPDQNRAAEAGNQNNDGKPIERGAYLSNGD